MAAKKTTTQKKTAKKPAASSARGGKKPGAGAKKTASKTTGTKKQSAAALMRQKQEEHRKRQVWAILLFALGLLLLALIVIKGQNIWYQVHTALLGLFGIGVFVLPVLFVYVAIRATIDENMGKLRHKIWQGLVFLCLLCGMIQVLFIGGYSHTGFVDCAKELYEKGIELKSGGVFSIFLGWPLLEACGRVGASVLILLFLFAFTLLITGTNLLEAFRTVSKPVRKMEEGYAKIREEKEIRREQRFNIDVDLGPDPEEEMPQHPVSSPKPQPVSAEEPKKKKQNPIEAFLQVVRECRGQPDFAGEKTEGTSAPGFSEEEAFLKEQKGVSGETPLQLETPEMEGGEVSRTPVPEDGEESGAPGALLDELVQNALPDKAPPPRSYAGEPVGASGTEKAGERSSEQKKEPAFQPPQEARQLPIYHYPPLSLLKAPVNRQNSDLSGELKNNAELLVNTLKSFGVQTRIIDISRGPTVTRYELQPSAGVKISKITNLADDIALNLAAAGVRIEAPIPNKAAVGIEVPNKHTETVTLREIVDSKAFQGAKSKLTVALGKDISGAEMVCDIAKMPHILIAGSTGSGKSVCINSIIMSILYKATPDEVKLLMVDPKIVELGAYNGIPHLLVPVVTDPKKAAGALSWAVTEMLKRYKLFADNSVRDLTGYNELAKTSEELDPMPQIMIVIDELADLMMAAPKEVEDAICRLAQMARAAGMHLVIATQRPSVDVITGLIKANIPSRISFAVSSQVDSRTILDQGGAEKLLGKGDMLFYPVGMPKPTRIQGCFVTDQERDDVIEFVKNSSSSEYDDEIMDEIEKQAVQEKSGKEKDGGGFEEEDELIPQAIECVLEAGQASTSYLQRRLKVGYARAARLIDELEAKGIVGPFEGSKPRQVLITRNQWIEMKLNQSPQQGNGGE